MQDISIAPVKISNSELVQRVLYELAKIFPGKIRRIGLEIDLKESFSVERNTHTKKRSLIREPGPKRPYQ